MIQCSKFLFNSEIKSGLQLLGWGVKKSSQKLASFDEMPKG